MIIKENFGKPADFIPDGMNAFERNVKRIGDCLLAFIALVVFSPLFLICYIAVRRIPAGGHAFLYGSQARNEARPDSDWGILILLDKPKIEVEDYDNISYPLVGLGWLLNECVSPVLYTLKDWMRYHFSPFVHSVKDKGIQFLSAEDITADSRCKPIMG